MKIGVLALQGAFIEHARRVTQLGAEAVQVRLPAQLEDLDGLIIPGGESTTIGKLAVKYGLLDPLHDFAHARPVWGTCAGMIFLAKDLGEHHQPLLGVMDMTVNRNAFGRQVDSFETDLHIEGLTGDPFHAVFIRAPLATEVHADARAIAEIGPGQIVAVQQKHWLATAFHPELTPDHRLHEHFLTMVAG